MRRAESVNQLSDAELRYVVVALHICLFILYFVCHLGSFIGIPISFEPLFLHVGYLCGYLCWLIANC